MGILRFAQDDMMGVVITSTPSQILRKVQDIARAKSRSLAGP
jgi:hypothetical protein